MRLIDAPVGIFKHNGELVLKTEYMTQQDGIYYPECYIVRTGERFWGGVKEAKDLNDLDVEPVNVVEKPFHNVTMSDVLAYVDDMPEDVWQEFSACLECRMRQIIYEYDETKPTNKDYLIAALTGDIDDGEASYESVAEYDINCPYRSYADCLNEHEKNEYGTARYNDGCVRCKLAWLDRAYDTYPSDDGIWEIDE